MKCPKCLENEAYCLCEGGAGNKNTPPDKRRILLLEIELREMQAENEKLKGQLTRAIERVTEILADRDHADLVALTAAALAGLLANPNIMTDCGRYGDVRDCAVSYAAEALAAIKAHEKRKRESDDE